MYVQAWLPILEGNSATAAWRIVDHIASALRDPPPPYDGKRADEPLRAALYSREPGFALFYTYLARAREDERYWNLASDNLSLAMEQVEAIASYRPYFSFGFAGTAWAYQHLGPFLDDAWGEHDPLVDIDDAILAVLDATPPIADPSLISGFVGYGAYALERMPTPTARACLERVCERLAAAAEVRDGGRCWRFRSEWIVTPTGRSSEDQFHTTIESGSPGPIFILSRAAAWDVTRELVQAIVPDALAWLRARVQRDEHGSFLPAVVDVSTERHSSGLIAAAALAASGADELAREIALADARAGASRARIQDASVMRGAAGIAHAYNRLYHASGDTRFRDAARAWLDVILALFDPSTGFGGFRFYNPEWQNQYLPDIPTGQIDLPGVAYGVAGIGLVLLAALTPIEPCWDRMFLVSSRSPEGHVS